MRPPHSPHAARSTVSLICAALAALFFAGCEFAKQCVTDGDCPASAECRRGACVTRAPATDGGRDAGAPDAGAVDAGGGSSDGGSLDGGAPDAGLIDAGAPDAGPASGLVLSPGRWGEVTVEKDGVLLRASARELTSTCQANGWCLIEGGFE